jgi:hypothetical protein
MTIFLVGINIIYFTCFSSAGATLGHLIRPYPGLPAGRRFLPSKPAYVKKLFYDRLAQHSSKQMVFLDQYPWTFHRHGRRPVDWAMGVGRVDIQSIS